MKTDIKNLIKSGLENLNKNNLNEAKILFEKALEFQNENPDALQGLGVINGKLGKHDLAYDYFFRASKIIPKNLNINFNIANSLLEIGKYDDSILYFDKALKINSKISSIWLLKGIALKQVKKYEEAEECFKYSINLNIKNERAYFNLASLYRKIKKFSEGIKILENAAKVFKTKNLIEVIYTNLSNLYIDINDNQFGANYTKAIEAANIALSINPENFIALNNLGMSHLFEKRYQIAALQLEKVVKLNPNFAPAFRNLGTLFNHLGKPDLSEKYLKSAIELEPEDVSRNFLLSEVLLMQNKFSEAWKYYEYRWEDTGDQKVKTKPNFTKPQWIPEFGFDGSLVIWAEQGIGDMILFSSILPDVVSKFKKVYLLIDQRLCQILRESIPNLEVINFSKPISEDFFDYHLPLCSLGLYFRNDIESFKNKKPLLKIKKNLLIKKNKKYRCGISWQSKGGLKSEKKNIGIEALHEIFNLQDIEFFDLQYTKDNDENINYKKKNKILFNKPDGLDIFNDLYGLLVFIDSCDFIISTSNTNAHLAAALGKKTYLLLPKEYGRLWYWDNDIDKINLWYPSIKKFNQKIQGEWSDPVHELVNYLKFKYLG